MSEPIRSIVVTGTSTGIGWGAAKVLLSAASASSAACARRRCGRLATELGPNFKPLVFDVTDEAAVYAAAAQVRSALGGATLAGLVNNAGISVPGPLLELPIEDFRRQFEVNLAASVIGRRRPSRRCSAPTGSCKADPAASSISPRSAAEPRRRFSAL